MSKNCPNCKSKDKQIDALNNRCAELLIQLNEAEAFIDDAQSVLAHVLEKMKESYPISPGFHEWPDGMIINGATKQGKDSTR